MTEPLNNSLPKPNFIGKSCNEHPYWQNQPLRLTEEQIKDPLPVMQEFFRSYHLNDARELCWNWFSAAITSTNDPLDRDNHLFFYEKVEALIEVVFVLKNKMEKKRRRKEKRRHKTRTTADDESVQTL